VFDVSVASLGPASPKKREGSRVKFRSPRRRRGRGDGEGKTNLEDHPRVVQIKDLNRLVSTSHDHERVLHVQGAEGTKTNGKTRQFDSLDLAR